MTDVDQETKRKIRRTALMLLGVVLVFYFGFILSGVLNS